MLDKPDCTNCSENNIFQISGYKLLKLTIFKGILLFAQRRSASSFVSEEVMLLGKVDFWQLLYIRVYCCSKSKYWDLSECYVRLSAPHFMQTFIYLQHNASQAYHLNQISQIACIPPKLHSLYLPSKSHLSDQPKNNISYIPPW